MAIWFTADTHFGHNRIRELAKRPFATVDEMDAAMISRWNQRVSSLDTVYHVGDFAFSSHDNYLLVLKGQKHLIRGNHDHSNRIKKATGWASISDMLTVEIDKTPIVLCHYGLRVWSRSHYGALHFYGHSHGNLPGDSQSCDVGVDCWDFRPVSLDEIRARLATSKKRGEPDHHQPKTPVNTDVSA